MLTRPRFIVVLTVVDNSTPLGCNCACTVCLFVKKELHVYDKDDDDEDDDGGQGRCRSDRAWRRTRDDTSASLRTQSALPTRTPLTSTYAVLYDTIQLACTTRPIVYSCQTCL